MRILVNYILVILFLVIKPILAGDSLKVMTYNLEGMKPGTDPETRIVKIIEKLKIFNPDIIGLQEINEFLNGSKNQGKRIADSLSVYFNVPYYFYQQATHSSWDNQFRESIGIISKYPVLESGLKQLVNGVFPRKVVWNYIQTPLGMINMFNTHLSFNSSSVRNQQVLQIIDYIKTVEDEHQGVATILTGDFNDTPNTTTIRNLTNTSTDTFYISTFSKINPGVLGGTVPASSPSSKIDYVFYKNSGQFEILNSRVIMGSPYDGVHYCSDHRGVLTIFTMAATGLLETKNDEILKTVVLYQNYPNPFNPSTIISYNLRSPQFITLKLFDVFGSKIKTLVNSYKPSGNYTFEFNAGKLSSGVYMYELRTNTYAETRRMVLVK